MIETASIQVKKKKKKYIYIYTHTHIHKIKYPYAFKLWCWRRLLRVLWTARRSNQLILKETNPEYLLEEVMLKLKL